MLKKSMLIMFIGTVAGCSSVSSYDKIAENVNYTYDHKLKQSVIKGPVDKNKTQGAEVKDFNYNLAIKELDTHVNVSFSYKDTSPRNYTHVVDSSGERYNFSRHQNKIVDCGVSGSFNQGKCIFSESFTFKMPRENRSQFAVVGSAGKNVYFEINKTYVSVMNDFVYKLKTPRSDYDEGRIKKETLISAKPTPVEKPDAKIPERVVIKPVIKEVSPIVKPTVIVSRAVIQKPLILSKAPIVINNKKNCATDNKSTATNKVYKPVPKKKPVLTPLDITSFCSCVKFKNSCAEITSCREAYDQLACGNKKLDPTNKGMPCPNVCKL